MYKCYSCKREWSVRRESLLEGLRIPLSKFVLALKLFVLEAPVNRAYQELGISYNTAYKVYGLVHKAIFHHTSKDAHLLKGKVEADESYFGGKRKGNCTSPKKVEELFTILAHTVFQILEDYYRRTEASFDYRIPR